MPIKEKYESLIKKITNTKGLVIILLVGVGLLLLPGQTKKADKNNTSVPGFTFTNASEYENALEKKLSAMLESIKDVEHAKVMITLEDSGEMYYAQNRATNEKGDSQSAVPDRSSQSDEAFVLKNDSGGGQSPLVLKTKAPRISGVLVTLEGNKNTINLNDMTNAVRAVLDVPAHRVKILFQT